MAKETLWRCPNCNRKLVTFVGLSQPPICSNTKAHSTQTVEMENKNEKE
jgi:hypothetical protein